MILFEKQKIYKIRKKFLLWPRRLYSRDLSRTYQVTLWLEKVTWTKTRFFPTVKFEVEWYTVMPIGCDVYKGSY